MLGEQVRTRVLEQLFPALGAPEAEEMSQPFPQIGFSRRAHHEFGTASRLIGIDPFRLCLAFDQKPQHLAGMPATCLRSEEHTSELQSLMRISYAVFCLKKKNN